MTSFIQAHPTMLVDFKLHDTKVVIDGYGLQYYLYSINLGALYGGEYKDFDDKCRDFFTDFRRCNVTPFVVFDGACDMDDKKLREIVTRHKNRLRAVARVNTEGRLKPGSEYPIFLDYVILKVLNDMDVPFAFCNFEADNEIAGLANVWNCPVIAKDSDFFIMDVKAGYLPLDLFEKKGGRFVVRTMSMRDVNLAKGASKDVHYLTAKRYSLLDFCEEFKVKKELMSLFATLCGNDYIEQDRFSRFLTQIECDTSSTYASRPHRTIDSLLRWLSNQDNRDSALQTIFDCQKNTAIQSTTLISLSMYIPSTESDLEGYFTDSISSPDGFRGTTLVHFPWFVERIRSGKISCHCLDVICTQRVFAPIHVENYQLPSANLASWQLRRILYGVLLRDPDRDDVDGQHMHRNDASSPTDYQTEKKFKTYVEVYNRHDREGNSLVCHQVKPLYYDPDIGTIPAFYDIESSDKDTRKALLLSMLKVEKSGISSIPHSFHLFVFTILYWLTHAEPKPDNKHLAALLLCWVCGVTKQKQDDLSNGVSSASRHELLIWDDSEVIAMIDNFQKMIEPRLVRDGVKLRVAHSFAQLQTIIKATFRLNAVLLLPYRIPDITLLYNGTLVHSLVRIITRQTNLRRWLGHFFQGAPTARKLYDTLYAFIEKRCPLDIVEVRSGSRLRSSRSSHENETKVSNMFAALKLQDED